MRQLYIPMDGRVSDLISDHTVQDKHFTLPNINEPHEFLTKVCPNNGINIRMNKGTTTLAFKYEHGVVVAVDSRATAGSYIASQTVQKVIEINSFLLGTMAGGAADCAFWERMLALRCRLYELEEGRRISVAAASRILCNMLDEYKGMGLSMGTMICGWDCKGPGLYYVGDDGVRLASKSFCVGSGATYAYGVLDSGYKWDLTKEDAIELGKRSIFHATYRDAMSGGSVLIYHVDKYGWERIGKFDTADLYYHYNPSSL